MFDIKYLNLINIIDNFIQNIKEYTVIYQNLNKKKLNIVNNHLKKQIKKIKKANKFNHFSCKYHNFTLNICCNFSVKFNLYRNYYLSTLSI